jgi:hypothetical protein
MWLSGHGEAAMKRPRWWKPKQKALIVLKGLKGRPVGELSAEHDRPISGATNFRPTRQKRSSRPPPTDAFPLHR